MSLEYLVWLDLQLNRVPNNSHPGCARIIYGIISYIDFTARLYPFNGVPENNRYLVGVS